MAVLITVDVEVIQELEVMVEADQALREVPADEPRRFSHPLSLEQQMKWKQVSVANTDRLREIIREHGWPGFELVGQGGATHAWLLAQHSDQQLDFQREAVDLLADAVQAGDADPSHLAYLTDRVRMNEGREQVYGTQMAGMADGSPYPWPIESADQVDQRRREVGLEPLADYIAGFGVLVQGDEEPGDV